MALQERAFTEDPLSVKGGEEGIKGSAGAQGTTRTKIQKGARMLTIDCLKKREGGKKSWPRTGTGGRGDGKPEQLNSKRKARNGEEKKGDPRMLKRGGGGAGEARERGEDATEMTI